MKASEPKSVNSLLNIIGVNSLWLGRLQISIENCIEFYGKNIIEKYQKMLQQKLEILKIFQKYSIFFVSENAPFFSI